MVMKKQNINQNLILKTDSYKLSQYLQYPEGTKKIFSYIESRGCKYSDEIMMFGMQYFLKKYLSSPITQEDINEGARFANAHGMPFNKDGWQYILENHDGFLPLKIKSVPEGTVIPTHNIMVSVENTDENCAWITSYIETILLQSIWYPSTVATNSFLCKRLIKKYLDLTSDNPEEELPFKLHDFGARGVSSEESGGIGGAAHLINFMGTDTIIGVLTAMDFYNSDVCGVSIPASEHSSMTIWGKNNEEDAYFNMLNNFGKEETIFAVVSDSYDIYNATRNIWGRKLLDLVEKRNSTVVIRPDSGDPEIVPVEIIKILMEERGFTVNSKGYKVLPDYVRVIQGDGINLKSIENILINLEKEKISISNIAFGMGGGLLQQLDRDTFKFAMKASAGKINGTWVDIFKDPITDQGKKSKKGRLTLVQNCKTGQFRTININDEIDRYENAVMKTVYNNGIISSQETSLNEIRERSLQYL